MKSMVPFERFNLKKKDVVWNKTDLFDLLPIIDTNSTEANIFLIIK